MEQKIQKILLLSIALAAITCKGSTTSQPGEPITPQAIYTKDDPGNWAGKEIEHTPNVQLIADSDKNNVLVTVTLMDLSESHYIEKIFIADENGKPWQEKYYPRKGMESTIDPEVLKASNKIPGGVKNVSGGREWNASFTLPVNPGTIAKYKIYARCSQHDLWEAPFKQ